MQVSANNLDDKSILIHLEGRMDVKGTNEIDLRFAGYCAAPHHRIIVDMSKVDYLSSLGIRALMSNCKAVTARSGTFTISKPQDTVLDVLKMAGMDKIITIEM